MHCINRCVCVCFGGNAPSPSGLNDTWHSHYNSEKQTHGSGAQLAYLHTCTHTLYGWVSEKWVLKSTMNTLCPLRQILKDMFMTSCLVSPCFVTRELSSLCPFSHPSAVTTFLIQSYLFSTCVKNTQKHAHNICSYFYFFVNCSV